MSMKNMRSHLITYLRRNYFQLSTVSDMKVGQVVHHDGRMMHVHNMTRQSQGAQRSVLLLVDFKDFKTGRKENFRFNGDEKINIVKFEVATVVVLYTDETVAHVMNPTTFDQFEVPKAVFGDQFKFLRDDMSIDVGLHEGAVYRVDLPPELRVKIQSISMGGKRGGRGNLAILEDGTEVEVPTYCEAGQEILIRPTGEFLRRPTK